MRQSTIRRIKQQKRDERAALIVESEGGPPEGVWDERELDRRREHQRQLAGEFGSKNVGGVN